MDVTVDMSIVENWEQTPATKLDCPEGVFAPSGYEANQGTQTCDITSLRRVMEGYCLARQYGSSYPSLNSTLER